MVFVFTGIESTCHNETVQFISHLSRSLSFVISRSVNYEKS